MKKILNKKSIIAIVVIVVVILGATIGLATLKNSGSFSKGNASEYNVSSLTKNKNSKLVNKNFVVLGSGFTAGEKSSGQSFVDYISEIHGANIYDYSDKNIDFIASDKDSYISFIQQVEDKVNPKVVLCEIPKNASTKNMGELSDEYYIGDFDINTSIGAMEYISAYADIHWKCKVVFFAVPNDNDENYLSLVKAANSVATKWESRVIDFSDAKQLLNSSEKRLYFVDNTYPTKAGYNEIIAPRFVKFLVKYF